ncbi:MAG: DUF4351 domain-containing protein [Aphanocapsa sp. GSE-SYN-MK-11-07L]|nr:DUF4351 domain-containing protein [Aphanocapsa sp. GSE-SYN-MK-11-07L]
MGWCVPKYDARSNSQWFQGTHPTRSPPPTQNSDRLTIKTVATRSALALPQLEALAEALLDFAQLSDLTAWLN